MAWKVFDIVIDGIVTLKDKALDIDSNEKLIFDGNIVPTLTQNIFDGKNLALDSSLNIVPGSDSITGYASTINKTIGPTGDFVDFGEAQEWLGSGFFAQNSEVIFTIEDGIHNFQIEEDVLFKVKGRQVDVSIRGSSKSAVTLNISKGTASGYNAVFYAENATLSLSGVTIVDTEESTTLIHLYAKGAISRMNDVHSVGGMRALYCGYSSSSLFWNVSAENMSASGKSIYYVTSDSSAINWYGVNIIQNNGIAVDGITAASNSTIQINYANMTIDGARVAIQAQYFAKVVMISSSAINILNSTVFDMEAYDFSSISFDKYPTTENSELIDTNTPLGEIQGDGSYITHKNLVLKHKKTIIEETGLTEYTPDLQRSSFFEYTITTDSTILNPTLIKKGDTGKIIIAQDSNGGHTVSFDTDFVFPYGSPNMNTDPLTLSVFEYTAISDSKIFIEFKTDMQL